MAFEVLLLSEPRFSEAELVLAEDVPLLRLSGFPLGKDLCHIAKEHKQKESEVLQQFLSILSH